MKSQTAYRWFRQDPDAGACSPATPNTIRVDTDRYHVTLPS
ncbi:hypothetical protein [Rhodococcus sp. SMB37]|nr:hypothetical protein [Rhodococcus sp. SMB37]